MIVWITALVITVIGVAVGVGLMYVGKKFYVAVDEREAQVRSCLPGNNCGACGFAGCDALAAAIVAGEAPVNGCPVGGGPVAEQIGSIMGTEAGESRPMVACVRCQGGCDAAPLQGKYVGVADCRAALFGGVQPKACEYGCLGLGSCLKVCPQQAITVENGVARVDPRKCIGCGLCVQACPKGLIELTPRGQRAVVRCNSRDRGPQVRQVCAVGCIGCGLCAKQCPAEAVKLEENLAHIDYARCIGCGACAEKCPAKVISPA